MIVPNWRNEKPKVRMDIQMYVGHENIVDLHDEVIAAMNFGDNHDIVLSFKFSNMPFRRGYCFLYDPGVGEWQCVCR